METGRAKPSRELVLHLAEHLDVPLRERNTLLLAAGYAPVYQQTSLDAVEMTPVRDALDRILRRGAPRSPAGHAVSSSSMRSRVLLMLSRVVAAARRTTGFV